MGMNETNDRKQEGPYKGVETQGKGRQSLTSSMMFCPPRLRAGHVTESYELKIVPIICTSVLWYIIKHYAIITLSVNHHSNFIQIIK